MSSDKMNIINDILNDRISSNKPLYLSRFDAANKMLEFVFEYHLHFNKIVYIPMGGKPISEAFIGKFHDIDDLISLACPVVKVSCKQNEKFGIGSLDVFGKPLLNNHAITTFKVSTSDVKDAINKAKNKQSRLFQVFKTNINSFCKLANSNVLIVDDGLSSGYSMLAAITSLLNFTNITNLYCLIPVASMEGIRLIKNIYHNVNIFSLFYDNSAFFFGRFIL